MNRRPLWLQRTGKLPAEQLGQPPLTLRRRQRLVPLLRGIRQPLQQTASR
jgi:hypothetical protein